MAHLNHTSVSPQQLSQLIEQAKTEYLQGNTGLMSSIAATFSDNRQVQDMVAQVVDACKQTLYEARVDQFLANCSISWGEGE